jgi:hypothetical protein
METTMTDDELCERANLLVLIADLLEQGAVAEKCDVTVIRDWAKGGTGITLKFEDGTSYKVAVTPCENPEVMADEAANPLVKAVIDHANLQYEKPGGWDIIVECMSFGEIEEMIAGCTTKKAAIAKVKAHADLLDDRRRDIQGA